MNGNGLPAINFTKNKVLFERNAAAGVTINATGDPAVLQALKDNSPFPNKLIELGTIAVNASGGKDVVFKKSGTKSAKASFSASAGASMGIGVFPDPRKIIERLPLSGEKLELPDLVKDPDSLFLLFQWDYDLSGTIDGSVAFSSTGTATFGFEGQKRGLYAIIRRFPKNKPARDAVKETINGWKLPRHVTHASDLAPGTWIIAETEGRVAVDVGAKVGYEFNWIYDVGAGRLQGDVGLQLDIAMGVKLGFAASGKYAVVLSRASVPSTDEVVRARMFKLKKKGWSFAFDASVVAKPDTTDLLPRKFDDFVAAVLGVHSAQILEDLRTLEEWTALDGKLPERLAVAGGDYVVKLVHKVTGIDPETAFAAAHKRIDGFLKKWHEIDHRAATVIWEKAKDIEALQEIREIAEKVRDFDQDTFSDLLEGKLRKRFDEPDFLETPSGRWLTSTLSGSVLDLLEDATAFKETKKLATSTLKVLDKGKLEEVLGNFKKELDRRLKIDKLEKVKDELTFEKLDGLMKAKLADFFGGKLDHKKVKELQKAINKVINKRNEYYQKAVAALNKKRELDFAYKFDKTTTRTALFDGEFDFATNGDALSRSLKKVIQGSIGSLMVKRVEGLTLLQAELTHGIERRSSVELTLPFFHKKVEHINDSMAKATALDEADGRVIVYDVKAKDAVVEQGRRNSQLAIGLSLPVQPGGISRHRGAGGTYTYSLDQAIAGMEREHLQYHVKPLVTAYLPDTFVGTSGAPNSFETWIGDLDKVIDDRVEDTETDVFGNTLTSLRLTLPGAVGAAWWNAPDKKKDPAYMNMSRSIQSVLKNLVPYYWLQQVKQLGAKDQAAAILVYQAIPPSTSIKIAASGSVTLDQNKDVYWDWATAATRRAMAGHPETQVRLAEALGRARDRLLAAGKNTLAGFYDPENDGVTRVIQKATSTTGMKLLRGLLGHEKSVVTTARGAGLKIAKFRKSANQDPEKAIELLAEFGSKLTKAFHKKIKNKFAKGAARPFGTLVFVEASRAFDAKLAKIKPRAALSLTVMHPEAEFPPQKFPGHGPLPGDDVVVAERLV